MLIEITTGMRFFELVLQNFGTFELCEIYVNVVENNFLRMLGDQVLREIRKRYVYNGNIKT